MGPFDRVGAHSGDGGNAGLTNRIPLVARPTQRITLADGRRLAFSELGDPAGTPIVHHHGMPGSRLDHQASPAFYARLGARVFTPDRPGYGLSDPHPRARLLDWAADVAALADAVGLAQFAVTGLSGGGIFALACAAGLPGRVTTAVVAGCPAPLELAPDPVNAGARLGIWADRHARWLTGGVVKALSGPIRRFPRFFIREATRDNSPVDRGVLDKAALRLGEKESIREAFRQDGLGYLEDIRKLGSPWGFDLRAITTPVQLWYGDQDRVIPPTHSRYLASVIPSALLVACPGEGHLLLWRHLGEIMQAAMSARRSPAVSQPEVMT